MRFYEFMSQIVDYDDADLVKLSLYAPTERPSPRAAPAAPHPTFALRPSDLRLLPLRRCGDLPPTPRAPGFLDQVPPDHAQPSQSTD